MTTNPTHFHPSSNFLVCIDSDGCAIDTMNIKHIRCFGPCFIQEWGLQKWENALLTRWNEINLYSMTRGINRFKGLALILEEVNLNLTPIMGISDFIHWTNTATELSNQALAAALSSTDSDCMQKALQWSKHVNAHIDLLPDTEKKAFPGVKEVLSSIHGKADIVIVSSANKEAVTEEWTRCGLIEDTDFLCCQDIGSKAHCINTLLKCGYTSDHVLMLGDAPGDFSAADENSVFFYPILVGQESDSWKEFPYAFSLFQQGKYSTYEKSKKEQFFNNLQRSSH